MSIIVQIKGKAGDGPYYLHEQAWAGNKAVATVYPTQAEAQAAFDIAAKHKRFSIILRSCLPPEFITV